MDANDFERLLEQYASGSISREDMSRRSGLDPEKRQYVDLVLLAVFDRRNEYEEHVQAMVASGVHPRSIVEALLELADMNLCPHWAIEFVRGIGS